MKMRQPLALLLGGLLSAFSVGCAAVDAVVSNSAPRPATRKASSERMVSIARVFENQGQYQQAEMMYRKAQRLNPNDPVIRDQLAQLAEKRSSRHFEYDRTAEAIAMADSLNRTESADRTVRRPNASTVTGSAVAVSSPATPEAAGAEAAVKIAAARPEIAPIPPVEVSVETAGDSQTRIHLAASQQSGGTGGTERVQHASDSGSAFWNESRPLPSVDTTQIESSAFAEVSTGRLPAPVAAQEKSVQPAGFAVVSSGPTLDHVLSAAASPDEHVTLLLTALQSGRDSDIRCAAATVLGECSKGNFSVRQALSASLNHETDDALLLAIADSQIQRGEATELTAECMARMAADARSRYQVQATTSMRYFAGTSCHDACVSTLIGLLTSSSEAVRAAAAVTLGDFAQQSDETLAVLTELAAEDGNAEVREAAKAAIARRRLTSNEYAEPVIIRPAH